MQGHHVALFPLYSKAHINPFLGLCPELLRRGYRVTLVTDESHAKIVVPAGAEPVIVEPCRLRVQTSVGMAANDPRCWEEIGNLILPAILNCAVVAARQLDKFYRENRPDLIIYDSLAYAGRVFAKRLQIPAVQYWPDFIHHRYLCWEGGVGFNPRSVIEFSKLLDAFLWAYGFEETNNYWHVEDLNLCPFPKAFQFDPDLMDSSRFCFVGPFLDRPFSSVWKNRSGGRRVILVSAITGSSDANYFNKVIDALCGSEYHVILSVGEQFPISELKTLPANFEVNRYASHLEILPHTDLHLYSGGVSGTLEGFYFGVRLIAVPSFAGNYKIAKRLAELGLVFNLPLHTLTSEGIRESVEEALQDDAFLSRVKQMQNMVRSAGGSAMAVDRVEEFLAGHA